MQLVNRPTVQHGMHGRPCDTPEVLEISIEDLLRQQFPSDEITAVPKGIHGGDVVQVVRDGTGTVCGTILWESKRTKCWSDSWLPKLRDDQRAAKAQMAILVSIEIPKNVTTFRHIDGIWITSSNCAISLASALRAGLVEIAAVKRSLDGRYDKMEVLYNYLSGQRACRRGWATWGLSRWAVVFVSYIGEVL